MALFSVAAEAFTNNQDYYEEIIGGPNIKKGYLVRTLEEVPKDCECLKTTITVKTYTKQYTGVTNFGGYETFYTIIDIKNTDGYVVLTKKQYQDFLDEWKDVEVYTKEEDTEICKNLIKRTT